jgi:hypothetical protein
MLEIGCFSSLVAIALSYVAYFGFLLCFDLSNWKSRITDSSMHLCLFGNDPFCHSSNEYNSSISL